MIKGVIFDLDGVIVSTDNLHYKAWKLMADKEGIDFDININNRLRGVSRRESLEIILEKSNKQYTEENKQDLMNFKNSKYIEMLSQLSPADILPNVSALITRLKKMDLKIAIGSSSKNAKKILTQIGLEGLFDIVIDGNDISYSKPNPEVFLKSYKALGLGPIECIVVEDAFAGIEAAKAAGMHAFAVGDAKKSDKADVILDDIIDLIDYIKNPL